MSRSRWFLPSAVVSALLALAPGLRADDPPKDDALDKLLEKVDGPKDEAAKPVDVAKPDADPPKDQAKPADGKPKPDAKDGEVGEKDKALDSLLEKLGETKEEAAPEEKGPGGPGPKPEKPPEGADPRPGEEKTKLEGETKKLDEHLQDLTGRIRKRKSGDQQKKQGGGDSRLAEAIKKMDEVEQRLKKTDTGEQTRKTQGEIVKQLDTILEEIRRQSAMSQGKGRGMKSAGQGRQPGQDGTNGDTAQGTGPQKPLRPTAKSSLADNKDIWGDLPAYIREDMENVFKEEPLTIKKSLVDRYFLSISKKSMDRKD